MWVVQFRKRNGSEKAAARRFPRTQRPILDNSQAHVSRGSRWAHLSQLMVTRPKSMSANLATVASGAIGPAVARRCVCLSRSLDSEAR